MVVEIENPANKSMKYGERILVKSIDVPDRLPQKVLYSPQEANRIYNEIENDIYEGQKRAKPYQKTKFPTVLKIIGGAIGLSVIILKGKTFLTSLKRLFK